MRLTIHPLQAPLGAEVRGCDPAIASDLDEVAHDEIVRALARHRVLIFRGHARPDAALVAFAERFGSLVTLYEHGTTVPGFSGIVRVSNIVEEGRPIGLAGEQELPWHHDHPYLACPARESFLEATELPARAPRTSFVDMVAALEALPPALRARIRGLRAVHHIDEREAPDASSGDQRIGVTPEYGDVTNVLAQERIASQRAVHPLVVRHPTSGLAALYASPLATHEVVGFPADESKRLLEELFARAIRPEFIYSHAWRPGDLVVWDTIATLHHREAFDGAGRRLMRQMSTQCGAPLEAA